MRHENATGLILAGGKSSRFGNDKAFVIHDGISLLEHSIRVLKPLVKDVVISGVKQKFEFTGLQVIEDETAGLGPAGGIVTCLKKTETELTFVLACDYPFLKQKVFEELFLFSTAYSVVIAAVGEQWHPLVGIYHNSVNEDISLLMSKGILSMHDLVSPMKYHVVQIENKLWLRNVNRPEDLG